MSSQIICPNCNHAFEPNEAIREEVQKELRLKVQEWQKKKEDEFRNRELELQKALSQKDQELTDKLRSEKERLERELAENLRKTISGDFESRLRHLQEQNQEQEEKLKNARTAELEMLRLKQELKAKESELEINLQKRLMEERERLKEAVQLEEKQKLEIKETEHQLQLRELQKQLEDQKGLIEQMKRKSEQGSMQMQGEVQELLLEQILQSTFPFDKIEEVGKGVRGADCIQTVRNSFGQEAGKIIYESKRTKDFGGDWIDKLKADMRSQGADVAVIVTQAFPKDMDRFGEKDGVYICSFTEVRSVALLLRNGLLKVFDARKSQENKGDKMVLLYDYLTGNEFRDQWQAIREGFLSMRLNIEKEKAAMEKMWKAREKQLEKVMLNAAHIRGSIEGIAGADAVNLQLEDDADLLFLDE